MDITINGIKFYLSNSTNWSFIETDEQERENIKRFFQEWISDSDFITGYTSGSTGTPKRIELSKKAMLNSAKKTNNFFNLKEGDNALLCLSASYIAGKMMIARAIERKLNLIITKPSSNPEWDGDVTFAAMVPMQVHSLLQTENGKKKLSRIKHLIIGGSAMTEADKEELKKLSTESYITYGMTETVSHIALSNIKKDENVFFALRGITLSADSRSCLVIAAPHLSSSCFVTNDVVELISEKSFRWLGRWDNVINSGGVKIHPETVEKKISKFISKRFYLTSEPDDALGQKVILKIEDAQWPDCEVEQLLYLLKKNLEKYEIPKKIYFIQKFAETENGKIKRK